MDLPFHTPLSAEQQNSLGIETPQPLALMDQVRFAELDVNGHVNNAAYMGWFETLRIRYIQAWDIAPVTGPNMHPRMVLRSGEVHFRKEMHLDQTYAATCGCTAFRNASFSLRQEIWSEGALTASFDCVMVLLHGGSTERFPLPNTLKARFETVDGASAS